VTSLGFRACTFPSAEAFLQSPLVAEASCLISDVQLPGTSGVELQHHLADLGLSIPTIFITAYPNAAVRARVLEAGAICLLSEATRALLDIFYRVDGRVFVRVAISVIRVLPRWRIHQRAVLARRMRPIKPAPICRTTPIIHQDPTMYSKLRRRVSSNTKA